MKICKPTMVLPKVSALFLLLTATSRTFVEVRGFVAPACGVTSAGRHARAAAISSTRSSVSMKASGSSSGEISRGAWVSRALGLAFSGVVAVAQGPGQALADLGVGEGGLPDGARQFLDLVKVQKDWIALGKTIKNRGANVPADEWKNVATFLRKVYQLGGELEYLAERFSGDKKKSAQALIRTIQKEVQAADIPARENNVEAFLAAQASVEKKFEEFMEMFNDVPSEL